MDYSSDPLSVSSKFPIAFVLFVISLLNTAVSVQVWNVFYGGGKRSCAVCVVVEQVLRPLPFQS